MAQTPLEKLIALTGREPSDERRAVLREVTDPFMVAPDRYGSREMELFDILLSRVAQAMDQRVRRLLAMALVRTGAGDEVVRLALTGLPSCNINFLRRSVVQTRADLFRFLQENTPMADIEGDDTFSDANSMTLPSLFLMWLYAFQVSSYLTALSPRIGDDRTRVLARAIERLRTNMVTESSESAREEIVIARRTVREWARRDAVTDDVLADLLESRAMTEFIFALMARFNLDAATTIRTLNDTTFESLAIVFKAHDVRRSVFAKTLAGFTNRKTDEGSRDRILRLYDRVTPEAAERAMRFWRIRVADMKPTEAPAAMAS
ncbi:DUF2336 domain-containing protein [Parvularcula sp. LCG005]|uniref:DUF2336 domain-containing protein n=1 Tax=Parvularcula sp. LCG005 TaxID=3078805 RepID=UPI002942AEB7|nr:DUF2336 domain-containing protein [Parvularcula sp. LCG005]WOI53985.1 DUF2336 domain-containing protein [Parvularcula sp. LCG005]